MELINNPTLNEIKKAAKALKAGHLVAFPTETVYGLGADATNKGAVKRIYSVKGRPSDHPLIVHISSLNELSKWAIEVPQYAITLARAFWPGPLTLILKRSELAKDFITGSQEYIGLRVPDQSQALALLSEFEKLGGFGVAAPSANRFGAVSPTTASAVQEELGSFLGIDDLILDGGQTTVGIESTIVVCVKDYPTILRPGAITAEMIKNHIDHKTNLTFDKFEVKAPGLLESHYSPKAKVVLDSSVQPGDGFIGMESTKTPEGAIRLGSPSDVKQFARDLYIALRMSDQKGLKRVVVETPKGSGLAEAIRDRVSKASLGN
jgi:L-threonylcarbamoyladenylate synthase